MHSVRFSTDNKSNAYKRLQEYVYYDKFDLIRYLYRYDRMEKGAITQKDFFIAFQSFPLKFTD